MRSVSRWFAATLAVALVSATAWQAVAQQPDRGDRGGRFGGRFGGGPGGPGGPGGFGGPGGPGGMMNNPAFELARLLRIEAVQTDLDLIEDQKTELASLIQERGPGGPGGGPGGPGGGRPGGFGDLSQEEMRERMNEMREQMETRGKEIMAKLDEVLLPHQMDRLKQIALQSRGIAALGDPEVADAIGLTREQREEIRTIQEKAGESMRERMQARFGGGGGRRPGGRPDGERPEGDRPDGERPERGPPPGGPGGPGGAGFEAMREQFAAARKETETVVMAVLTDEQKTKYNELIGTKIDLPEEGGGFGGFGGGGFGGRFGGGGGGPPGGGGPGGGRTRGRPDGGNN